MSSFANYRTQYLGTEMPPTCKGSRDGVSEPAGQAGSRRHLAWFVSGSHRVFMHLSAADTFFPFQGHNHQKWRSHPHVVGVHP